MALQINLLVDAHSLDDHFQGSRTYILGLYRSMVPRAPWIHFYFAGHNIHSLEREFGIHENVFYVDFKTKSNLFRLVFDVPRIIKQYRIDVAHFQYAVPFLKTCQEIVTIHDVLFLDYPEYFPFFYKLIRTPIFKKSAHRADLLLTVSDYAKQSISQNFEVASEKIHVIPNGIDKSILTAATTASKIKARYILYVSRWEPRKNHLLLMQAFNELHLNRLGYKLIFIGKKDIASTPFDSYWETIKEELYDSVLFLDSVSQEDLIAYYQNSALFVYPSLAEGFGIPPIEAAALGIPVLCSNTTAMSDFTFLKDGLFNPEDKEELKQKITKMLARRDEKTIEETRSHVVRNYDWDTIAVKYLQLITDNLIKDQGPGDKLPSRR